MRHAVAIWCSLIGLAAIAAGSAGALRPVQRLPETVAVDFYGSSPPDPRMQRLADASCRCERHAGPSGRERCWANFERRMKGSDSILGCGFEDETRCNRTVCVTMRRNFAGTLICSDEEASAVAGVLEGELRATRGRGPLTKTDKLLRDIVAGKPLPKITDSAGCGAF